MYYYYHQYLQGVLAAERWATAEDLSRGPHSLLGVPSHEEARNMFARLKLALGKETGRHITLMKEKTVTSVESWPVASVGSPDLKATVLANHPKLIAYFLTEEVGRYGLINSNHLILPPNVPHKTQTSQESLVLEEVNTSSPSLEEPTLSESNSVGSSDMEDVETGNGEVFHGSFRHSVNFQELHQNFSQKKEYHAIKEDGKIILENSTLTFEGYQLAQDINQAAHLLNKIFCHIEDISKNYGDALRDIDAQISDELHFIEFADVDTNRCVKSYKRLQELRVKRRCVKDSMLMANLLVRSMGMELPEKLSSVSEKINHLDHRTYVVRVPEEFQHETSESVPT